MEPAHKYVLSGHGCVCLPVSVRPATGDAHMLWCRLRVMDCTVADQSRPSAFPFTTPEGKDKPRRRVLKAHFERYPWLAYSHATHSVYCSHCVLFGSLETRCYGESRLASGGLDTLKYVDVQRIVSDLADHAATGLHIAATGAAEAARARPHAASLPEQLAGAGAERVQLHRERFKAVAGPLLLLARQGLATRGHRNERVVDIVGGFPDLTTEERAKVQSAKEALAAERARQARACASAQAKVVGETEVAVKAARAAYAAAADKMLAADVHPDKVEDLVQEVETLKGVATAATKTLLAAQQQGLRLQALAEAPPPETNSVKYGNFPALLAYLAQHDPGLREHLIKAMLPGASAYTSPDVQNEILDLAAELTVEQIVAQVLEAKYFTVTADESMDLATSEWGAFTGTRAPREVQSIVFTARCIVFFSR